MRCTWVSTTTPTALPNHEPRTTLAVLRAAPGTVEEFVHGVGDLSAEIVDDYFFAAPTMDLDLLRKNPVDLMSGSSCFGSDGGEVLGSGVLFEDDRRHHVHACVRALGGEDGCDEEFPGAGVVESALDVGITGVETGEDFVYAIWSDGVVALGELGGFWCSDLLDRLRDGGQALTAANGFCTGLLAELGGLAGKLSFGHCVSDISWTDYNVLYSTNKLRGER